MADPVKTAAAQAQLTSLGYNEETLKVVEANFPHVDWNSLVRWAQSHGPQGATDFNDLVGILGIGSKKDFLVES